MQLMSNWWEPTSLMLVVAMDVLDKILSSTPVIKPVLQIG